MIFSTDDKHELFDIVDKDDNVVGRATRGEVHRNKNLIHRSVGVAILNSRGEIFLQQRSVTKDTDPGLWTISCSGHVLAGDDYRVTAIRELKEELGLDLVHSFLYLPKKSSAFFVRSKEIFFPISLSSQRNWRKKGWPSAGFLVSLTSGDREGPRLRDKPFPSPSPLGKRNYQKPARAEIILELVGKYLCHASNETEMQMLYRIELSKEVGPLRRSDLNKNEIIQGKFFTQKELDKAIKKDKIRLSFMGKKALEKLGWIK